MFEEIIIYNDMRKRLEHTLIKELVRWCKTDWRKLFLAGAVMSIIGIVLPTFLLTYHRNLSRRSLNGSIANAPFVSMNSSIEAKEMARALRIARMRRRRGVGILKIVPPPPPRKSVSPHFQIYLQSLSSDEALLHAKKEIGHAPLVDKDNKDSYLNYELMEMILKVYIYREGEKPVFHKPELKGIYASEGWFMRLMEANREFVTKEPEEAHLFYLPYSSRQLELALYVPKTRDLRPLANFIRDYVNMIASNYPFWNSTYGSDHFFVACHDWGPFITSEHIELKENSIKALCNADVKENFTVGRDVSLPETSIKNAFRSLRNIGGGIRVSQRQILAFFAGNVHGRVRPKLLEHWRNKDADMRIYGPLPGRFARNMTYIEHMKSSKYCICPMGYEVNSPRIVEAIYYECVPLIIADSFVLPLSEVLDWNAFSVTVAEINIPKLKEILLAIPLKRYLKMPMNLKMVQKHFLWNREPMRYDMFHMILHSIWHNRLNQIQVSQS